MSISWNRTINRFWFNLNPFIFRQFIEESFDTFLENSLTRDSSINIDTILKFTEGNIISWAAWWIIFIRVTNISTNKIFRFMILPWRLGCDDKSLLLSGGLVVFLIGVIIGDFRLILNFFLMSLDSPLLFCFIFFNRLKDRKLESNFVMIGLN